MNEILRQKLMRLTRRFGLMTSAERVRGALLAAGSGKANQRFVAEHPGVLLPPVELMHDPYGVVDYSWYWITGQQTAGEISRIARQRCSTGAGPVKIFEWGCGPARIIRHVGSTPGREFERFASDYNRTMVDWCRANITDVSFDANGLAPPLRHATASFDFVYCLSVFTHLSEAMYRAWFDELLRVLKPGGCLLLTLHGDYYRRKLLPDECERYDAGALVVREGFREGGRMFTTFHPERFVRDRLLREVTILSHESSENSIAAPQDVWLVRKDA